MTIAGLLLETQGDVFEHHLLAGLVLRLTYHHGRPLPPAWRAALVVYFQTRRRRRACGVAGLN